MKCPSCGADLKAIRYEGIQIETCEACHGEWLDASELKHIVKTRESRFNEQERRAVAESRTIPGVRLEEVDRDLTCPKCAGQTDAVNYGGDSGIIIDRCAACRGIWLDASEMERIEMLVESWDDGLEDHLAKYGPRLRRIAADVDRRDDVSVSRFGFVNALINGILDII